MQFYVINEYNFYLKTESNINLLKPNEIYIDYIKDVFNYISYIKAFEKGSLFVDIPLNIFNEIVSFSKINLSKNPLINFIANKFQKEKNRYNLSYRKIAESYYLETGKHTNRQTVCNII